MVSTPVLLTGTTIGTTSKMKVGPSFRGNFDKPRKIKSGVFAFMSLADRLVSHDSQIFATTIPHIRISVV